MNAKTLVSNVAKKDYDNSVVGSAYGIVLKTNEKENVCDILYVKDSKKLIHKENTEVLLRDKNDNWFPKQGDLVTTRGSNNNDPIITGELIRDYARDAKISRNLVNDVMPGNVDVVRGQID